jgi:hypothetical protein
MCGQAAYRDVRGEFCRVLVTPGGRKERNVDTDSLTKSCARRNLRREIARQRDRVLDWEIVVNDARSTVDRSVEGLRTAVAERDRAAEHLTRLMAWAADVEGLAGPVGAEQVGLVVDSAMTQGARV